MVAGFYVCYKLGRMYSFIAIYPGMHIFKHSSNQKVIWLRLGSINLLIQHMNIQHIISKQSNED